MLQRLPLVLAQVKAGNTSKILLKSDSKLAKKHFKSSFILKALFVLKILKFLSWLFGHVEKTAWLET